MSVSETLYTIAFCIFLLVLSSALIGEAVESVRRKSYGRVLAVLMLILCILLVGSGVLIERCGNA